MNNCTKTLDKKALQIVHLQNYFQISSMPAKVNLLWTYIVSAECGDIW